MKLCIAQAYRKPTTHAQRIDNRNNTAARTYARARAQRANLRADIRATNFEPIRKKL